jgi:hypothetical protein
VGWREGGRERERERERSTSKSTIYVCDFQEPVMVLGPESGLETGACEPSKVVYNCSNNSIILCGRGYTGVCRGRTGYTGLPTYLPLLLSNLLLAFFIPHPFLHSSFSIHLNLLPPSKPHISSLLFSSPRRPSHAPSLLLYLNSSSFSLLLAPPARSHSLSLYLSFLRIPSLDTLIVISEILVHHDPSSLAAGRIIGPSLSASRTHAALGPFLYQFKPQPQLIQLLLSEHHTTSLSLSFLLQYKESLLNISCSISYGIFLPRYLRPLPMVYQW